MSIWWLSPTLLKNDGVRQIGSSSQHIPTIGENEIHVPNHQPDVGFLDNDGHDPPQDLPWRKMTIKKDINMSTETFYPLGMQGILQIKNLE